MLSTNHHVLLIIMLLLMNSNQESARVDADGKRYMLAYIYMMDDVYPLSKSDIVCTFDVKNHDCPNNGVIPVGSFRGTELFEEVIPPDIRFTGSATSSDGYGRIRVYLGCTYNCAAIHPTNNYEINYFGLIYSKWIADSISFKIELELKN